MYTPIAATIGHVYLFIPFMVTAIYLSLVNFDFELARDGQDQWRQAVARLHRGHLAAELDRHRHRNVLVFIPCLASAVTPRFLGGPQATSFGMSLAQQFGETGTWALGSAMGVVLFVVSFLVIVGDGPDDQSEAQRLHRPRTG